MIKLLTIN